MMLSIARNANISYTKIFTMKEYVPIKIRKAMAKIRELRVISGWPVALMAARHTVGKTDNGSCPSDEWKRKMLLAEHSPIRLVQYAWIWDDIPMWVTTHFVRHHIGCEKFVRTQRTDRTGSEIPRGEHPQGELNEMLMVANAQEIMAISRVRLCSCASMETREAWKAFLCSLKQIDPVLVSKCVPTCVYRGFCPELKCCGYCNTREYRKTLDDYRRIK